MIYVFVCIHQLCGLIITGWITCTLTVKYSATVNAHSTADAFIIDHIEYNMNFKEETLIMIENISPKVILCCTYNDVM